MSGTRPPASRGAQQWAERERAVGLDPEDEAARWLAEHDPPPPPPREPKVAKKSKAVHRFRQQQAHGDR